MFSVHAATHTEAMPHAIPNLPLIQRALLKWHDAEGMHAPWRDSRDPYESLVAAVMAQQTQMSRVMVLYERFMTAFPTVEALAAASRGDVIRVWKGMGYNQRAVRLHNAARTIARDGWPRDAASLAQVDGVGPFTAAIIASYAFGQAAACVDTNVVRILTRLVGDETLRGRRLQDLADACMTGTAAAEPARWNQTLMDYGARVCMSRPKCGECVVSSWCASYARESVPQQIVEEEKAPYGERTGQTADVQEQRARSKQQRAAVPQAKFEHTPRYFRGRIVDLLRELRPGRTIAVAQIAARIGNEVVPTADEVESWVGALEKAGLVERRGGRIRLPA